MSCKLPTLLLALSLLGNGYAQTQESGIPVGEMVLYPSAQLKFEHDDNFFFAESQEQSVQITTLSPQIKAVWEDEHRQLSAEYQLEAGFHSNSSADDYLDQRIAAELGYRPSARTRFGLHGEYRDDHDRRGTERTDAFALAVSAPDEWHSSTLGALFGYGADTAKTRMDVEASYTTIGYDNNRDETFARDRDAFTVNLTLFYQLRPKTSLLLQASRADIRYDRPPLNEPSLDSIETQYLAGLSWQATAKTRGTLKAGLLQKDFDSAERNDYSGTSWSLDARWAPRSYSAFTFSTARRSEETTGLGDFILRQEYLLAWRHFWLERLSSTLHYGSFNDQYDPSNREDDISRYGAKVDYRMRRWLNLGLGYQHDERDSSLDGFDYNRNVLRFTIEVAL